MTACPSCGGTRFERSAYPGADRHKGDLVFTAIDACLQCGLGIAEPRPSQSALDAYYSGGAYWDAAGGTTAQSLHARNQCEQRARFVAGLAPSAPVIRALDIGAGEAWLGAALRKYLGARIAEYQYVEPDPGLRGPPRLAGELQQRGFASLAEVSGPYEIVFLNQVLEHVADPAALLAQARELLAPEGILYVETPNADHRFKDDVFPHTLFFTPDALASLMERRGFESTVCEAFGRSATRPTGVGDIAIRAAFRATIAVGAGALAQRLDDAYWEYSPRADGLWVRWLGRKANV